MFVAGTQASNICAQALLQDAGVQASCICSASGLCFKWGATSFAQRSAGRTRCRLRGLHGSGTSTASHALSELCWGTGSEPGEHQVSCFWPPCRTTMLNCSQAAVRLRGRRLSLRSVGLEDAGLSSQAAALLGPPWRLQLVRGPASGWDRLAGPTGGYGIESGQQRQRSSSRGGQHGEAPAWSRQVEPGSLGLQLVFVC